MIKNISQLVLPAILFTILIGCGGGGGKDNPINPYFPPIEKPQQEEPIPNIPYPQEKGPLPPPISGIYYDTSTDREGRAILPGFKLAPKRSSASLPMRVSVVESDGDPLRHIIVRRMMLGSDFALIVWDPTGFYNPRLIHSSTLSRTISFANERTAQLTEYLGKQNPATTNIGFGSDSIDISVGLDQISKLDEGLISTYWTYFTDNYLLNNISQLISSNVFGGRMVTFSGTYNRWNLPEAVSTLTNNGALIFMGGYVDIVKQKLSTFQMGTEADDLDNDFTTNSFMTPRMPTEATNCFIIFSSFMQVAMGTDPDSVASNFETTFLGHPVYTNLGDEQRYMLVLVKPIVDIDPIAITAPATKVKSLVLVIPLDPRIITIEPMDGSIEFSSGITEIYKVIADYAYDAKYTFTPVPQIDNWFRNHAITNVDPILPGDVIAQPGQGLLPSATFLAMLNRYVSVTHYIPDYLDDEKLRMNSNLLLVIPEGGSVTNLPPNLNNAKAQPTVGRVPLTVTFDATGVTDPDGSVISYEWNFGNPDIPGGGTDTGAVVKHMYASPGVRTAILTVKDDGIPQRIVQKQFSITITENQPPVAKITVDVKSGRAPLTVNFSSLESDDPDGQIMETFWDFGDGQFSLQSVIQHVYTEAGTYIVTLRVKDDGPQVKFDIDNVTINVLPESTNRNPIASFTADPESGEVPLTVQFDSSASYDPDGNQIVYQWNFGDIGIIGGGVSHEPNPAHVYNQEQVATVTLTVTDDGDPPLQGQFQKQIEVLPVGNQPPVAVIERNPDAGQPPLTVTFSGASSYDPDGQITGYSWNFGDPDEPDGGTAFGAEVQHTYNSIGVFEATLIVSDNGTIPLQDQETIEVIVGNSHPNANIQVDHDTGYVPLTVHFDATGSTDPDGDDIVSYHWDFGTGDESDQAIVDYQFTAAGKFIVTLTVVDDGSPPLDDQETMLIDVIEPQNDPPVVVIKADVTHGDPPLTVNFNCTDESYDPDGDDIVYYSWEFGDGLGFSDQPNPTYEYTMAGEFRVVCQLTDDGIPPMIGEDDVMIYVGVNQPPVAVAESDVIEGFSPLTVQFTGENSYDADGSITTYTWDFATGDYSNDVNPQFEFTIDGQFIVSLTVEDDAMPPGTDMDTIEINVYPAGSNLPPVANIIALPTSGRVPLRVDFNAMFSTDPDGTIIAVLWNFGDPDFPGGGESTDFITQHTYASPGVHTVTLTVWDDGTPVLSDTDTVNINATP